MTARPSPAWALTAAVLGSSMSFIDGSAVNVALPILGRDLGASLADVQWVVEGYALFLSALILLGGSLGDLFGRRLAYGCGIVLFAVASIVCGFAPNIETLIAARCVQGIGGALATPGSLALISAAYDDESRGRAIGTWSGFSAMTSALGPLIGGWLVQIGSWRAVFFINVPIAIVVLAILALRVPESVDPSASRRIDVPGALAATFGLGSLVYGLIRLQGGTLDPLGLLTAGAGLAGLATFAAIEIRSPQPMVRLDLFRSRAFTAANVYTFLLYAALGGSLYFLPFDLINVQGYAPAAAGAVLLPFVAIVFVCSRFSGGLVTRVGARGPLVAGGLLAAAGFGIFAFAGVGHPYWTTFFPGAVVLGLGGAAFVAPLTTTVMAAVESSHAGIASGINNAVARAAGLVAVAALGIALADRFEATLARDFATAHLAPATSAALERGRAQIVAGRVPAGVARVDAPTVGRTIRAAFADGFRVTMLAASGLCVVAAGVAAFGFSGRPRPLRPDVASR